MLRPYRTRTQWPKGRRRGRRRLSMEPLDEFRSRKTKAPRLKVTEACCVDTVR